MASGDQKRDFRRRGGCSSGDCEVTLVMDQHKRLYACKDELIQKGGEFFTGLFTADFKEKNKNKVRIRKVSRADMLLFLKCTLGSKPLPSNPSSLSSLISLADQFICPSLQSSLNAHLDTQSMFFGLSPNAKLSLLCAAETHKGSCLSLLETCIRLCANLLFSDIITLNGRIPRGTMWAICATVDKTHEHMKRHSDKRPSHWCRVAEEEDDDSPSVDRREFDGISAVQCGENRVEVWVCDACDVKLPFVVTYKTVKKFKIDQDLLTKGAPEV